MSTTSGDLLTPGHCGGADWILAIYILPTGSPGSYSLSHTGDAYLSLRSLNGEGLSIAPSLQPQVRTEDSCRVDLIAVKTTPATQSPWPPTLCIAPLDPDLSSDPRSRPDFTFDPVAPPPTQVHTTSMLCTMSMATLNDEQHQSDSRSLDRVSMGS